MFSTISKNRDYVVVDEDAVIDIIASVGINRDKIEVDFDTHTAFFDDAGILILYINEKISDDTRKALEDILETHLGDDDNVYDFDVIETDDGLIMVEIKFNDFIYNENEEGWI